MSYYEKIIKIYYNNEIPNYKYKSTNKFPKIDLLLTNN